MSSFSACLLSNKRTGLYCSLAIAWLASFGPSTHTSGNERAGGRRQSAARALPYNSKALVLGATTLVLLAAGGYWFYTRRQRTHTPKNLSTSSTGNTPTSLQEAVTRDLEKEKDKKPKAFEETIHYLQQQTDLNGNTAGQQLVTDGDNQQQHLWALAVEGHSIALLEKLFDLGFNDKHKALLKKLLNLRSDYMNRNTDVHRSDTAHALILFYFKFQEKRTRNKWFDKIVKKSSHNETYQILITQLDLDDLMKKVGHDMEKAYRSDIEIKASNSTINKVPTSLQEAVTRDLEKEKDNKPKAFKETIRYLQQQTDLNGNTTAEELVTDGDNQQQHLWELALQEHSIALLKQLFDLGFNKHQALMQKILLVRLDYLNENKDLYQSDTAHALILFYFTYRETNPEAKNDWFDNLIKDSNNNPTKQKNITQLKLVALMEEVRGNKETVSRSDIEIKASNLPIDKTGSDL